MTADRNDVHWADLGGGPSGTTCREAPPVEYDDRQPLSITWAPVITTDPDAVTCQRCASRITRAPIQADEDEDVRIHHSTWTTPHANSQFHGIETLMPTSPSKPRRPIEQLTVTTGSGATITLSGQDILGGYDLEHDLATGILRVALCDVRVVEVTYADGRVQ